MSKDELVAVSMEEFGPIAVDWFTQREVVDVIEGKKLKLTKGTDKVPVWAIEFSNGGYVLNYDPLIPKPKAIKGAALTMTVLTNKMTELRFGLEQVFINPIEYAIWHPELTKGKLVFAQRSEANMPRTIIPPADESRAADRRGETEDDGA